MKPKFIALISLLMAQAAVADTGQNTSVIQACMNQFGQHSLSLPESVQMAAGPTGGRAYIEVTSNPIGAGAGNTYQGFYDAYQITGNQFHTDASHQFNVACACINANIPNANTYFTGQFGTASGAFTSGTTSDPSGAKWEGGSHHVDIRSFMDSASTNQEPYHCIPMIGLTFPVNTYPFWDQITPQQQLRITLVGTLKQ